LRLGLAEHEAGMIEIVHVWTELDARIIGRGDEVRKREGVAEVSLELPLDQNFSKACHVGGFRCAKSAEDHRSGSKTGSDTPRLKGLGSEPTLRCGCDEMAADVEGIVDRSMHGQEL
jgi:hypothetical protein